MKILEFEWNEGNVLHLELRHGITPLEAEEVFAVSPLFRKTREKRYVALGPTREGRYLAVIFEYGGSRTARVVTGWDMSVKERKYYAKERGRR